MTAQTERSTLIRLKLIPESPIAHPIIRILLSVVGAAPQRALRQPAVLALRKEVLAVLLVKV